MEQPQTKELFDNNKLGQALAMYQKNSQDPKAVWIMHYYYENGWCGVTVDKSKAITCLKIAAAQGHAGASYKLVNYLFTQDILASSELIYKYTSENHVQKCIDKTDDYNDLPYYNQQEYIRLLSIFKEQPKIQVNSDQLHRNLIKRKTTRLSP
jgi:TPR repeat protein